MSMTNGGPPAGSPADAATQAQPSLNVLAQYVKDLSFENPLAPAIYQQPTQPQIDVSFNIGTQ